MTEHATHDVRAPPSGVWRCTRPSHTHFCIHAFALTHIYIYTATYFFFLIFFSARFLSFFHPSLCVGRVFIFFWLAKNEDENNAVAQRICFFSPARIFFLSTKTRSARPEGRHALPFANAYPCIFHFYFISQNKYFMYTFFFFLLRATPLFCSVVVSPCMSAFFCAALREKQWREEHGQIALDASYMCEAECAIVGPERENDATSESCEYPSAR